MGKTFLHLKVIKVWYKDTRISTIGNSVKPTAATKKMMKIDIFKNGASKSNGIKKKFK